ncbi:MAG: glycosyltransferase family 2 protein [Balneolaceae bacterium]|nr:glycosyltransferase family 2 protein [Balneolaceae bacterium]
MSITIMTLYAIGLLVIFLYTMGQAHLIYHYFSEKGKTNRYVADWSNRTPEEFPQVTVQLPVYNERYVVNRLIDSVANFNWPKDKLEIQVLDDSSDETVQIIVEKVQELQQQGYDINHIQRGTREGFKAGALTYGMQQAKGAFIAIFDADFTPHPDFLMNTVPCFEDENIGMVQTRWTHLNQDYSLLTKVQAFALNAHFTVEQKGRNRAGYFMNFNGTAGVWRRSCIKDAGGWEHDTLTEDLDLSYRAQMKGWDFLFLEDIVSPAELPVAISALKTQQYRWTKGAAESARKHLSNVWNSNASLIKKIQASSHLLSSSIFIFILLVSVLSVPLLWLKNVQPELNAFFIAASFLMIGLLGWLLFYGTPFTRENGLTFKKAKDLVIMFPVFLSISMALSVHNSIAVIKGLAGRTSPFVRTPKFNVTKPTDSWSDNKYLIKKLDAVSIIEGGLALYFLGGIVMAFIVGDLGMLPFHLMLFFGFATIFGYSFYEKMLKSA